MRVAAGAIERLRRAEHAVVVLGGVRERLAAERCGLPVVDHISLPMGSVAWGRSRLRRMLCGDVDGRSAIVAWSARAAVAAAGASAASAPWRAWGIADAPLFGWVSVGSTGELESLLMRRAARCGRVTLLAATGSVRDELCAIGVPPERVRTLGPGVELELGLGRGRDGTVAAHASQREELRARWGAEPEERMVGLFADPADAADVRLSCYAVAIARVAERPMRLVMHPSVHAGDRWRRWSRRTGLGTAMAVDAALEEPWAVAGGLDFAIALGERRRARSPHCRDESAPADPMVGRGRRDRPMIGALPVLWLMASGVPVIAEGTDSLRGVIDHGETGLLFNSQDHVQLARLLTGLCDDPPSAVRLAQAARARIADRYGPERFAKSLEQVLFGASRG